MEQRCLMVHFKSGTILRIELPKDEAIETTEIWADWRKYQASFRRHPNWNSDEGDTSDYIFLLDGKEAVDRMFEWRKSTAFKRGLHFQFGFIGGVGWGFPLDEVTAMDCTNVVIDDCWESPPVIYKSPGFFARFWDKIRRK